MKEKEYECYRVCYNEGEQIYVCELGKNPIESKKVTKIEYIEIPTCAAVYFHDGTFNIVFNLIEVSFRPIKKGEKNEL